MQRDMDLVRKILFYVEENYVAGGPKYLFILMAIQIVWFMNTVS